MIIIKKLGDIYAAQSDYSDKDTLKAAGFWYNDPRKCNRAVCLACPLHFTGWYTPSRDVAAKLAQFAEPGLKSALQVERDRHVQSVEMSRAKDVLPGMTNKEMPAPPGLQYLPFQRAGIAYADMHPSFILGDEMGLGKTIQVLGAINSDPGIRKVLIFCPATLRLNWLNEAQKWLVRPMQIKVIEGRELPDPDDDIVIVNYDKIVGKFGEPLLNVLMSRDWDLLACDEAHKLKNPDAKRTKAILGDLRAKIVITPGIASRAKRRIVMTGTPFLNSPIEIWPLLMTVSPDAALFFSGTTPTNAYWHFAAKYCEIERSRFGTQVGGAKGGTREERERTMLRFQEMLRGCCMIRRRKAEVLTELPPKTRQIITLAANGMENIVKSETKAWEKYESSIEELRAEMMLAHASGNDIAYRGAAEGLRRAAQVGFTEISKERHKVAMAKVPYVVEHVEDMIEGGVNKVILFAHHRDVISECYAAFEKLGYQPAIIVGGQDIESVQDDKARFQEDPNCKVIVCSIMAAGVGHTLTAASNVVFAELDWVPMNVTQAEDRTHRLGQTNNVLIQHLVVDGSLDAKMVKTMIFKQEAFDAGMDTQFDMGVPVPPTESTYSPEEAPKLKKMEATTPRKYPVATDAERVSAQRAVQILAGVCDYAGTRDKAGFNKLDAHLGHALAKVAGPLTDGQVFIAKRMAAKYHRQLPDDVLGSMGIQRKK